MRMWRLAALASAGLAGLPAACDKPAEGARLTVTVVGAAPGTGGLAAGNGGLAAGDGGLAARLEAEATQPTLIARDNGGQIVPGLGSSWRFVDDGGGLILRLRPMQWSDGSRLGANEVVAAFRRAAARGEPALFAAGIVDAPGPGSGSVSMPPGKLGVSAPISRVVELRLVAPSPLLLGWLAEPGLGVGRAATPTKASARLPAKPPARPPATLAAYDATGPAARRLLTRRSPIATPESRPAAIVIASSGDAAAAVAGFGRGDSDIVIGAGLAGLGEARTVGRADTLRIDPLWGVYGYVANGHKGPLADARVRLALTLAVDRAALVQRFGVAAMVPVEGLLPPSLVPSLGSTLGSTPASGLDLPSRATLAEQLLRSAGYAPATPLRIVLLLPPGRDHVRVAEAVAARWSRLGVTVVIAEQSPAAIAAAVAAGDFDLALTEASLAVPDAGALLGRWRCGVGPSCSPEADALLDRARLAAPADRPALLAEAEARLLEAPPMVPLFTPVRWALVARRVNGWVPNPAGSHPLVRLGIGGR